MSPDYDEYDALLEEPFGEGIDWAAIDLLSQAPLTLSSNTSTHPIVHSSSVLVNQSVTSGLHESDDVIIIFLPTDESYQCYTPFSSSSLSNNTRSPSSRSSRKKTKKSKRPREASKSPVKDQINCELSPCKLGKRKRAKKKKYIRDIENILECTICFNIIAAAYSLPCGHTACGICLHKWLDSNENNNTCFICREPSKGFFVPNFSIDQLAEMHFKNKLNMDDKEKEEYQQWLSRAQSGRQKIQQFNRHSIWKRSRDTYPTADPPRDRGRRQRQR